MKKIFFLMLMLISILASYAQQIKTGVKADVNFFRINGDGMSPQFHPGISAGFFAEIKVNNKWSVQPELLYSQRNTKAKDFSKFFSGSVSLSASNDVFLSYISFPLVLKYQLNSNLSLHAGAQYNYLIYEDEDLLKDNMKAFSKNDVGVLAGAGYAATKRLGFYARFYYGLNDINHINSYHNWTVQQFQAGASYALFGYK